MNFVYYQTRKKEMWIKVVQLQQDKIDDNLDICKRHFNRLSHSVIVFDVDRDVSTTVRFPLLLRT